MKYYMKLCRTNKISYIKSNIITVKHKTLNMKNNTQEEVYFKYFLFSCFTLSSFGRTLQSYFTNVAKAQPPSLFKDLCRECKMSKENLRRLSSKENKTIDIWFSWLSRFKINI